MAEIPSALPPDVSTGTVWTASQVNRVYAYCDARLDPPRIWDEAEFYLTVYEERTFPQHPSAELGHSANRYAVGLTIDASANTISVDQGSAGIYLVGATYWEEFPTTGHAGLRYCRIQKNESNANEIEYRCHGTTSGGNNAFTVMGTHELAVGDTLRWQFYQSAAWAGGFHRVKCQTWAHWIGSIPT